MHPRDRLDEVLRKEYGKSLVEIAAALGYSDENMEFLRVDLNDETACDALWKKHSSMIEKMKVSTSYRNRMDRGKRTPVAMFANLVQGWVTEDLTVLMLRRWGYDVGLSGVDKDRNIYNVKIVCEPDTVIRHNGREQLIELATEYTKYGLDGERPFFELRKTKFLRCHEKRAFVLYRNLSVGKYILVDLTRGKTIVHKVPKSEWNVYSMRYYFDENGTEMRTLDKLHGELRAMLERVGEESEPQLDVIDEMPKSESLSTSQTVPSKPLNAGMQNHEPLKIRGTPVENRDTQVGHLTLRPKPKPKIEVNPILAMADDFV